jgi:hypothetical protein
MALARGCSEFDARRELERNGTRIPLEHVAIPAHNGEGWLFRPIESQYLHNAVLAIAGDSYAKDEDVLIPNLHLLGESLTAVRGGEYFAALDFGTGVECRLLIEGRVSLSPSSPKPDHRGITQSVTVVPALDDLSEILAPSRGRRVSRCEIGAEGGLTLELDNQIRIVVEAHPKYQAWTFTGFQQVIVCIPGGRVAIFGP